MFQRLLAGRSTLRLSLPKLPSICEVCHSWPAQQVCQPCIARFASPGLRCNLCALPLPTNLSPGLRTSPGLCADCIREPPPVDATLVAVTYAFPWAGLVSLYKFGDKPGWAAFFATLLLDAPGVRSVLEGMEPCDLLLPMPLSKERLQSRGFNQAWQLVGELAAQSATQAQADAQLLLRVRDTQPQTELKRAARLSNVEDAFQVDPLRAAELAGRQIILVDDVMTSGASVFSAAKALRAAGARHITAMAFARTPAP